MKNEIKLSCVMPAYDEGRNIARVLKVICNYKNFNEIIVVDDGSKDNTSDVVRQLQKKYRKLRLVVNPKNIGKTDTVKRGISIAKGELIMICDADLIGLTNKNICALVNPVLKREYDLTISNRAKDMMTATGYTNLSRFFCGERVFWKKDFQKIKLPKKGGYLLEVTMDLYYIYHNKRVMTIYFDNLYTILQFDKRDFKTGLKNYIKMYRDIYNAASLVDFINFYLLIKNDRFSWLYDVYYLAGIFKPLIGLTIFITSFADGFYLFFKLNFRKIFA